MKNVIIVILVLALAGLAAYSLPGLKSGEKRVEVATDPGEGMLKIVTQPGDAKIFINGERKGNSPAEVGQSYAIKLAEGSYKIEAVISSDGQEEDYGLKDDVFVAKDSMQTVNLELHKRPSAAFREKLKAKYPNGIPEPKMVAIPGGSFKMGCDSGKDCSDDEKPVHQVTLSPFQMSVNEVTFEQYDACVAFGGCVHLPDDRGWGRGNRPVINVSWEDAQQYIQWLNQETGKNYRLPTEAQWEYAARAGSTTKYSWGNEVGRNKANCDGCGSQWDNKQTAPVGSFAANAFGLYDMHGNVWEWCQDWYDGKYYQSSPAADPQGPPSGEYRVFRGGSWGNDPAYLRSAYRSYNCPGIRYYYLGFRLSLPN
jgi:formylglycine-generating enzyme required for sulfatase activity